MYSKYEEMRVMKGVIKSYADNQKKEYESVVSRLKDAFNSFPLDISSDRASLEIGSLQLGVSLLSDCRTAYVTGVSVLNELNKAARCYEQNYTLEQLQPGGIAEQRAEEGNRIFYEIRTKNVGYKKIIDEISYSLFVANDPHLSGLEDGLDAKLDSLGKQFERGELSKEELIYYTNMCASLSKNPDYIEYMSQFQQAKASQGVHK